MRKKHETEVSIVPPQTWGRLYLHGGLTADGRIHPCLGNHVEVYLRAASRKGADDGALKELLETALSLKPLEHQLRKNYTQCRPMIAIGD